jgi:hypothetical protein
VNQSDDTDSEEDETDMRGISMADINHTINKAFAFLDPSHDSKSSR